MWRISFMIKLKDKRFVYQDNLSKLYSTYNDFSCIVFGNINILIVAYIINKLIQICKINIIS